MEVGVEVFGGFTGHEEITPSSTPAGEAVTTAHFGAYDAMAPAYAALDAWCAAAGRQRSGISWELYGDAYDDPALNRTDLFWLLAP